jgi:hypothetical protein
MWPDWCGGRILDVAPPRQCKRVGRITVFWAFHALQHALAWAYTLNNLCFHPVNHLIDHPTILGLPLIIGTNFTAIFGSVAASTPYFPLQHYNIMFDFNALVEVSMPMRFSAGIVQPHQRRGAQFGARFGDLASHVCPYLHPSQAATKRRRYSTIPLRAIRRAIYMAVPNRRHFDRKIYGAHLWQTLVLMRLNVLTFA